MATYYGTSEMQSDGLQTLYLMNPGYVGYSDTQPTPAPTNMIFLNAAGNTLNPPNLPHPSHHNQHFVGIPFQPPPPTQDPGRQSIANQHEVSAVHGFVPRVHYNLWSALDPTAASATTSASPGGGGSSGGGIISDMTSQLGLRRSFGGPQPHSAATSQQGLSLSLSPQPPAYGAYRPENDISAPAISPATGDEMRISGSLSSASAVSAGISGFHSVLMGSKYLKAAQQLLDEVVNVGKGVKNESNKGTKGLMKANRDSPARETSGGGEINGKRPTELTTAERQEFQMKKAKLVSMLDEVEQKYRQYHHQMQVVVSTFEAAAGAGSARTYTALALQTISRQFRCLRDAISSQIRATSKSLGEEESLGKGEGSRLRLVDQHLRQQRALQQLGMMQHNAWRPQRGLPERSVSILRAWLFEHFLHPYPKDSDKHLLAKQTGLTRSQVSNWFINARVRLWKPMVEEMYLEETKEQEQNGSDDKANKSETNEDLPQKSFSTTQENSHLATEQINSNNINFKQKTENINDPDPPLNTLSNSPNSTSINMANAFPQSGFQNNEVMLQGNSKKARIPHNVASIEAELKSNEASEKEQLYIKFGGDQRPHRDGFSLITDNSSQGGSFGGYPIGEIGRFDLDQQFAPRFSNGVSLTLGLPHCENLSLSASQQTYLSNQNMHLGRRLELGDEANDFCNINNPSSGFEGINAQNRKRFAAQLLPDFVA